MRCDRYGGTFLCALLDLDWFKRVNGTHSHGTGDAVLQGFAQPLKPGVRATDIIGRYGGEEFVVLLVQTEPANRVRVCERVRTKWKN